MNLDDLFNDDLTKDKQSKSIEEEEDKEKDKLKEGEEEKKEEEEDKNKKEEGEDSEGKKDTGEGEGEGNKEKDKEKDVDTDQEDFWGEVAKLSGEDVEIDFEGIDPTTPEGALKYAQAFREKGIEDFFTTLKEKHPREYRALELVAEGYDPSSLYEKVTEKDYKAITLSEDAIQHKNILLDYCKLKGLDEETSKDLIESAENKGNLKERSEKALEALKAYQKEREEEQRKEIDNKTKADQDAIDVIAETIQSKIQSGDIAGFNIPEKDKNPLIQSLYKNIQVVNGKVLYVKELTKDTLDSELQAEYLKLKKGNLKDIVIRTNETKKTLKLQTKKEKEFSKNTNTKSQSKVKSLDELF